MFRVSIIVLFILASCAPGSTSPETSGTSIEVDSTVRPKRIVDTADEKKAYGNLRFGMKAKEVEKSEDMYGFHNIGAGRYYFSAEYDSAGRFSKLLISGMTRNASYYDTDIKNDYFNLISVISEKYGPADKADTYPNFSSMNPGYIIFSHLWTIGDKVITIGVGEKEAEYYACAWIYSQTLEDAETLRQANADTKKIKQEKDKF
ncbi:MAG: hypothetical protein ABIT05_01155 [Chitinophagaceae bacterium]